LIKKYLHRVDKIGFALRASGSRQILHYRENLPASPILKVLRAHQEVSDRIMANQEEKVFDWVWMKRVLSVYNGTITLFVPFIIAPDAAAGVKKIQARVKYQGCTASDCLPPNFQTVEAGINVRP